MTLEPLLSAPMVVQGHAFGAMAAFVVGGLQLLLPKGTPVHRAFGWIWVILLAAVAIGSFWINGIRQFGPFSAIHGLSIVTLISLLLGVRAARGGDISRHRAIMTLTFFGALVIAGVFTLWPGRIMHAVLFGS